MFRFWTPFVVAALLAMAAHGQDTPKSDLPAPDSKSRVEQASYGLGMNIGRNLKANGFEVNFKALSRGIQDALTDSEPDFSEAQITAALKAYQQEMQAKAQARAEAHGAKNKREGKAFLAKNKQREGVKTLESGLQYKVLKQGNGPKPKVTDTVTTHYHGTLIDGTVFDSSIERDEPATFPVGGVIRGWTEALQLMPVGSKWRLFVPSQLAYGPDGAGSKIGPHAVLIFDIELLGIE